VRLGGQPLELASADDDSLVVHLPPGRPAGTLEIDLGGDEPVRYSLAIDDGDADVAKEHWTPDGVA
jgi:hypothetical protein